MRLLVVKLSSLGDVVHTMPAVQDILRELPGAQIDWVVEEGFAELAALCKGVQRVIPLGLRRWRKQGLLSAQSRAEWGAFKQALQRETYDVVIDFQGLIKSAFITRLARITPQGQRIGLANRSDGAGYEPLARLGYTHAVKVTQRIHAIERSRQLVASMLTKPLYPKPIFKLAEINYELQEEHLKSIVNEITAAQGFAVFVHATSRADKLWREASWVKLGAVLAAQGLRIALPWGSAAEQAAAERIAQGINALAPDNATVLPKLGLASITALLARSALVVGVDSGLVHMASGLDTPTVQLYNFPTAWRTGGYWSERTVNVEDAKGPSDEAVMQAVNRVMKAVA